MINRFKDEQFNWYTILCRSICNMFFSLIRLCSIYYLMWLFVVYISRCKFTTSTMYSNFSFRENDKYKAIKHLDFCSDVFKNKLPKVMHNGIIRMHHNSLATMMITCSVSWQLGFSFNIYLVLIFEWLNVRLSVFGPFHFHSICRQMYRSQIPDKEYFIWRLPHKIKGRSHCTGRFKEDKKRKNVFPSVEKRYASILY